jgi:cytochrome c biogenesis protein CcdA/glutaredoxin
MKRLLLLLLLFAIVPIAYAQSSPDILLFYGEGCPHCSKASLFLDQIQEDYPSLEIEKYEIYFNEENRNLFQETSNNYETEIQGVPTIFINDKFFVGFNEQVGNEVEKEITFCQTNECIKPLEKTTSETTVIEKLTIPAVIGAAAVDAINPCAFAVLIILLTTILASSNKKRALFSGIAFTIAIFISYFLMGIGLYSAITYSGLTHTFYTIVAVLAILLGLFNLKDYLWYGKLFKMEVPDSWRPNMKKIIRSVTSIPGAFLTGFVVSLFLLPCTSGPYIVILGLLAKIATRNYALLLLVLYNLIFILPMLIITLLIYFGFTTTEKAESWRQNKLKILHLIAGILLLLLGIGMFIAMNFGIV